LLTGQLTSLGSHGNLLWPLLPTLWLAWGDIRNRRIPNYLPLLIAVTGAGYQVGFLGWQGLVEALLGLSIGFGLMLIPYLLGGMGAGDVKAVSALGTWLGPQNIFLLLVYMALAGGIMALGQLLWKGSLWTHMRYWLSSLYLFLCKGPVSLMSLAKLAQKGDGGTSLNGIGEIPYGVAIAIGMVALNMRVVLYG
jgi:prepilin peptidase CpaA